MAGGTGSTSLDLPKLEPAPDTTPERLETGTQNHEGIAGAGATVDWLASLAEGGLAPGAAGRPCTPRRMPGSWSSSPGSGRGLAPFVGVTRYGPAPSRPRTGTLSSASMGCRATRRRSSPWRAKGSSLSQRRLLRDNGGASDWDSRGTGLLRIGLSMYSTAEEVERVLAGIERLSRKA